MRCGTVKPGPTGPWHYICVETECDGVRHYLVAINGGDAA